MSFSRFLEGKTLFERVFSWMPVQKSCSSPAAFSGAQHLLHHCQQTWRDWSFQDHWWGLCLNQSIGIAWYCFKVGPYQWPTYFRPFVGVPFHSIYNCFFGGPPCWYVWNTSFSRRWGPILGFEWSPRGRALVKDACRWDGRWRHSTAGKVENTVDGSEIRLTTWDV